MARYKVILAYDGARYIGFQRQRSRARGISVQTAFEDALHKLGWQGKSIQAAGRTDTGVHAAGQIVAFDLNWNHAPDELRDALNAYLPFDLAVRQVDLVPEDFRPRNGVESRSYSYRLFCDPIRDPLQERCAWRVWPEVNLEILQQAADLLIGRHDFAAFGSPMQQGGSTVRKVFLARWLADGGQIVFDIVAEAFLYHMVRRLVYVQVQVAQGRRSISSIVKMLANPVEISVHGLAPAHGLTLQKVVYADASTSRQDNLE